MKSQLQCYLRMIYPLIKMFFLSLKKAWKLGLCHCADQASFKKSCLYFSYCVYPLNPLCYWLTSNTSIQFVFCARGRFKIRLTNASVRGARRNGAKDSRWDHVTRVVTILGSRCDFLLIFDVLPTNLSIRTSPYFNDLASIFSQLAKKEFSIPAWFRIVNQ